MTETTSSTTSQDEITQHRDPVQAFLSSYQQLTPDTRTPASIIKLVVDYVGCTHGILLKHDNENATLQYAARYPKQFGPDPDIYINVFNADEDSIIANLVASNIQSYTTMPEDDRLKSLVSLIRHDMATLVPLKMGDNFVGLLALYHEPQHALDAEEVKRITALSPIVTTLLDMLFSQAVLSQRVADVEREAEIFSRIDEELSETIELSYVFTMMKDWALRFTNADAAALALYNHSNDNLRIMSQYGFKSETLTLDEDLPKERGGIMLRVARRGLSEIVPDVSVDSDYFALADGMSTQMTVPIKREERVIGVLTLLSKTLNGFTDDHLDFTKRLANRAGVAVDNARLFTETRLERERLSYILRNIGDNVILVGLDHRIEMINSASILAFQLSTEENFVGKLLTDSIVHAKLQIAYQEAVETDDTVTTELDLPNGRTYHVRIEHHQGIGRVIVMQDITYFKETERLKTELVATVSHDLKQPLAVMRGYIDLLKMINDFDKKSLHYVDGLNIAFYNMRQLIDDLLDIARIEAGLELELEDVSLLDVLKRSISNIRPQADKKQITIELDVDSALPIIHADPRRLEQIFNNLISNAVKYSNPEGNVKVYSEVKQNMVRIFVKDNGMGIGAEDQTKVFERFYRVRRPETDSIEGTGLGLAIVKSLVEAHEGKIDLKSILGEGATFRVTLPYNNQ
ncbi:MAG: ATP-binding protein [Chloroflexota bacterium]